MSYTSLIHFRDGKMFGSTEFRNARGGAARIWTSMFDKYIPKRHEYDSWIVGDGKRLWDLVMRKDISRCERASLAFTFDLAYVRNENFKKLAEDLRGFSELHPCAGKDHLPSWAVWIEENGSMEAVGLYATSVGENQWVRYIDDENQELVPVSEGHEVYDTILNR